MQVVFLHDQAQNLSSGRSGCETGLLLTSLHDEVQLPLENGDAKAFGVRKMDQLTEYQN